MSDHPDSSQPQRTGVQALVVGLLLSLLSMWLLLLSFPPYRLGGLIFVALVPMLVAQFLILPARWSSLAPAIALGGWLGIFFRQIFSIGNGQMSLSTWMNALPFIIGGIVLLTDRSRRRFHERTHFRFFIVEGIVFWIGLEQIRLWIFGTWGFLAHPLYQQTWFLQPVSVFGVLGLSTLVIAVNYGLAFFLFNHAPRISDAFNDRAVTSRSSRKWLAGITCSLLLWMFASLIQWNTLAQDNPSCRVAVIQPGTDVFVNRTPAEHEAMLTREWNTLIRQTHEAGRLGARLIVWPEAAIRFDPKTSTAKPQLQSLAKELNAYLVIGYAVFTDAGARNESVLLTPAGEFLEAYGKAHPVFFAGETSISRGTYPVHATELGKVGTPICYDLDYTDVARIMAGKGAQILASPSNDWPGIAAHHYTHTVFRAIENRVAILKSERAWDSAIVEPSGKILSYTESTTPQEKLLVAEVALSNSRTIYTRIGDFIGWLCLAGLGMFMAYQMLHRPLKSSGPSI